MGCMLGRGGEDVCSCSSTGARAWDHIAGRGLYVTPCPQAGPHHVAPGSCSADASPRSCVHPAACPPASVSAHQPPSDLQSSWEVAGLPPQASHTDSPAACLVPFQTTQMLLIKGVPIV